MCLFRTWKNIIYSTQIIIRTYFYNEKHVKNHQSEVKTKKNHTWVPYASRINITLRLIKLSLCNHRYESSAVTNYHENICKNINYNWKLQKFDILLCEERRIKISHRRVETRWNEINLFYLHVTSRLCNQILDEKRKKNLRFFWNVMSFVDVLSLLMDVITKLNV